MISKEINFNGGLVIKDDFINIKRPLEEQADFLYEDMLSIYFDSIDITLDIGWYENDDSSNNGDFIILLIKNELWDEPVLKVKTNTISELLVNIEATMSFVNALLRSAKSD